MTDRELLEQSLYVIEAWDRGCEPSDYWRERGDIIEALRGRLAQPQQPCPTCLALSIAVMNDQTYHDFVCSKKEWVGLTNTEFGEIYDSYGTVDGAMAAVEDKLKEKNK